MTNLKRIVEVAGLLVLSLTLVLSYGQQPPPLLYPVPAINAFGSCPDAIKDHFMKSTGRPPTFEVPASVDLIRAQIRIEDSAPTAASNDQASQRMLSFEVETLEPIPSRIRNAQSVFFFALDLDRNKRTGRPEPTFDLGMDLSAVAQYNRGFAPRFFVLLWPTGGFNPVTLQATAGTGLDGRLLRIQIPLSIVEERYRALRGGPLPLDDPQWGAYSGFWRESTAEDPAFDIFPERSPRSPLPRLGIEFVDQELLVRFKEGITRERAEAIIAELGTRIKRFFELFGIYHLEIIDGTDVLTKIKQFQARMEVDVAGINGIWCSLGAPNDQGFSMQWGLLNQGQSHPMGRGGERRGRAGADIGIMRAWDGGRTDSSSVLIGVIDSGADPAHPDLTSNLRPELGFDFIKNDATPEDNIGHGTFVSSLIGAVGNNGADLSGVSWKAALVPLKATDKLSFFQKVMRLIGGITWDNFLQAMDRALKLRLEGRHLRVINFSAGGPLKSELLDDVIRLAGERGILFVTAAGNDGRNVETNPIYPCAYREENIICVAASTDEDKLASFSNFSPSLVHLAAPGADVVGLIPGGLKVESETLTGNAESRALSPSMAVSNGTSFAAPHVTAVAALLFANCPLTITVADIKKAILDAAERKPELSGKVLTGGRLRWPEQLPAGCQGR